MDDWKLITSINFQNEIYTLMTKEINGKKLYKMEDANNNFAIKKVLKKDWKEFFKLI